MSFRIDQLAVLNLATVGNSITAGSFVRSGGTSSQFLKADGTVDTNAYITGITSTMVTTALGYTPVPNTRNITINGVTQDLSVDRTWTISAGVSSVTGSGSGISVSPTTGAVVISNTGVTSNVAGTGISVSGATGAVTITNTGVTSVAAGTGISVSASTGGVTITNTGVTSVNGSTGAITGIITTSNYNSYSPTLTGGGASGTWGISISGNAATVTNGVYTTGSYANPSWITSLAWSKISSTPTTISGYGITDALYQAPATIDVNAFNTTGLYRGSTSGWTNRPPVVHNGGALLQIDTHPGNYFSQMFFDTGGNRIYIRAANAGTWGSWETLLNSGNYNSYAPTLTGGGASGTWGINITGTAGSETLATVTGRGATTATDVTFGANSTSDQGIRINYGNYVSGYGRIRFLQDGTNHSTIHSFSASWQSGTLQTASSGAINLDGQNGITIGPWNNPSVWIDNGGVAQARGSFRAPIFYDSDNTAYYLNPASGSTSLRIAGGIAQNDIVGRPAAYWGSTGTTGAVVIKFPGNTGNYGMIHAVIDIYEYNGNDACTVIVGGHNWNGAWYNYGAQVIGNTDKPVRVGVKDGQYCIVIGNGSSSWSYGQVVLRKIQNGTYYSGIMDIAGGYTVAIESDTYSWVSGDLRNLETPLNFYAGSNIYMGGNIVATQSWVNSQGFVTGGPFVPSRSQSNWNDGTVIGNTVGMLAWKNYGNGHVIFDASASTSPSGSGVNNTNSAIAWSSTYPTLMGWNGSQTYGVRVDSARISDNTSGNADTVDGYHASTSNIGNYIVVRDGNGYIFGNYINMTDDGNPGGGTSISSFITKQGDNYYRSVSPTNAMVSIRGVASGSWGINITGSSSSSTTASYLPTLYAGGVQSNPQVYFGQSIGLRVAMTGIPFAWCDTLWINGYSGGDVLSMTALHTARNGQPRMWLSTQSSNGTSYGTTYEFLTEWNYTNYTLPIGGGWYGVNMPGSRWGGYAVSGGEIVFGNGLPNAGQMGMLIDGAYVAGENNGFWSLPSNNDWNGRRGMYWDGSYLNFTANSPTSVFTTLRLANGFELQQGGSNYGQFNTWVDLPGFHGLYSAQNSAHFYPNNGTYGSWIITGSRNGWGGIEFGNGSNGSVVVMLSNASNESGFHNNSYGWQIFWSGGALYSGRNTYGGNHSRVLQEDTWISSKYFGSDGYIYGVRFSDSNDSSYFLDPNGTSELNSITTGTRARWGEPRIWTNRQAYTSDQNYWTGTNGWGTSEGNWDNAWKGGFSGWDIWGTGTAHPQGSGYIHAQGIVSGQHYAASDGSSGYGWMMVGAADATANRYWLRGKWGGTTSGWVEMITSGNIGSQNVNYASQAGTASFASSAGNTSSISSATGGSYTWTGQQYFQSNLGGYCGSLSGPPLQAYSTSNNSAFFSFHKSGQYAVNMGLDADSVLRIGGWSAAANRWQLDMSGNMTVAGDVTAYSDARVKENVETVEDALDKVLNLRGVYYNRTDSDDKRRKVGVIAQEILEVIPEVVGQDNDGMYNVSYGNIVGVLIEAIKEQQKQIDELKARLD